MGYSPVWDWCTARCDATADHARGQSNTKCMEMRSGIRVVSEAGWVKMPPPTLYATYNCTYAPLHVPWQRTHHTQRDATATGRKKGWEGGRKYAAGKRARVYNVRAARSDLADNVGRGNPRQLSSLVKCQATALHCMEQASCTPCVQLSSAQADFVDRGRARQPSSMVGRQELTLCWSKHRK